MKKITLLFAMLLFSIVGFSQFTEGFETEIPATFTVNNGGAVAGNTWVHSGAPNGGAHTGTGVASITYEGTAHNDDLITPQITVAANVNDKLSFWIKSRSGTFLESYEVRLSTTNTATASFNVVLQSEQDAPNSWENIVLNLSGYIGQSVYVAIKATDTNKWQLFVDDVVNDGQPSCIAPTILTATGITATTATLGWTTGGSGEPNWDVEVLPVATAATGTPTDTGVTNTFNKTGLTANTAYKFYVRANCGGGASTWSGPFNFTTPCVAVTAPFVENFENAGAVPSCWSLSGAENWRFSNTGTGEHIGNNGTLSGATASGGYFAWVDSSLDEANAILTSPLIDVSGLTTPSLSFYEISDNEGDTNAQLLVEVYDGAAWNTVGTYAANTAGWEQKFISLAGLTITGPIQIRFTFTEPTSGDFTDDIAIDDVAVNELPTCLPSNTPNVTAITATSASLAWTSGGSGEANWDIEVLPAANTATGTPTDTGVTNPVVKNSLNPATDYKFYVRANCGAGGLSPWAGPFTFTTACGTVTPSYTQEFTTYPGACWTEGDNTDIATGPNGGNGVWAVDGFLNNGVTGAARVNIFGATDSDWLVTPTFDLSSGSYGLAFDTGVTAFTGTGAGTIGADDKVLLLISNDDGTTWITLDTFDNTNSPSNTGDAKIYDLAAYTSATTKFAFLMTEGATSGGDINFYVDNFKVDLHSILGVEEVRKIERFVMYPNPVEDKLTISAKNEIKQLLVVNMLGQTIKTVTPNSRDYQLDFSDFNSGIYFVKASVNNTEETFRIVKK